MSFRNGNAEVPELQMCLGESVSSWYRTETSSSHCHEFHPDFQMETIDPQVTEELEALASIYGDDLQWLDQRDLEHHFTVAISNMDTKMEFKLSPGYPTKEQPNITIIAPHLRGESRKRIENHLRALAEQSMGQSCIYQLIEETRQLVAGSNDLGLVTASDSLQPALPVSDHQSELTKGMYGEKFRKPDRRGSADGFAVVLSPIFRGAL